MKKTIAMVALILIGASVGLAQGNLHVPPRGSAERKALIKAIRVYDIARNDDLKGELFQVSALKCKATGLLRALLVAICQQPETERIWLFSENPAGAGK